MAELTESVLVEASLAEVWGYYFEPSGWPAWVDGFHAVESAERLPGGRRARWSGARPRPAAARCSERVLAHEPRTLHRIAFADPESSGELTTRFEVEGEGTRVTLELDYALPGSGPFAWLTERIFVRGQVRAVAAAHPGASAEAEELSDGRRSSRPDR